MLTDRMVTMSQIIFSLHVEILGHGGEQFVVVSARCFGLDLRPVHLVLGCNSLGFAKNSKGVAVCSDDLERGLFGFHNVPRFLI